VVPVCRERWFSAAIRNCFVLWYHSLIVIYLQRF
jgi:hypothetical protein